MLQELTARAHAKMNLFLQVGGLRPDGYHEIKTVLQSLDLADRIKYRLLPEGFAVKCSDPDVPADDRNLCVKAAALAFRTFGLDGGLEVTIDKYIPMEAGLGGGSADAAATVLAVDKLFGLAKPQEELLALAEQLGSDVPAMLVGGTVLAEGKGERVRALQRCPPLHLLIARPDLRLSTREIYADYDRRFRASQGDVAAMLGALEAQDSGAVCKAMHNDLGNLVEQEHLPVWEAKEALLAAGAVTALVCGSGPAVAGLFLSREDQQKAAVSLLTAPFALVPCGLARTGVELFEPIPGS